MIGKVENFQGLIGDFTPKKYHVFNFKNNKNLIN